MIQHEVKVNMNKGDIIILSFYLIAALVIYTYTSV